MCLSIFIPLQRLIRVLGPKLCRQGNVQDHQGGVRVRTEFSGDVNSGSGQSMDAGGEVLSLEPVCLSNLPDPGTRVPEKEGHICHMYSIVV